MTASELYHEFPSDTACISYLETVRWKGTPVCPYCDSDKTTPLCKELRHHCNVCNTSFSVTVGTIFHRTHLPLQKWFLAIILLLSNVQYISVRQLAKHVGVNRNTGWYMITRIYKALETSEQRTLLQNLFDDFQHRTQHDT